MKTIKTSKHFPPINSTNLSEGIDVSLKTVNDSGYCNACTNRSIIQVFVIKLRSLELRLCFDCKMKLIKKLVA